MGIVPGLVFGAGPVSRTELEAGVQGSKPDQPPIDDGTPVAGPRTSSDIPSSGLPPVFPVVPALIISGSVRV